MIKYEDYCSENTQRESWYRKTFLLWNSTSVAIILKKFPEFMRDLISK